MFEWKLNGRRVTPSQIAKELSGSIKTEARKQTTAAIARIRCPVHGQTPRSVRVQERPGDRFEFEYQACCDRLRQAVTKSFR